MFFFFGFVIFTIIAIASVAHFLKTNPRSLELFKVAAGLGSAGPSDKIPYGTGSLDVDGVAVQYMRRASGKNQSSRFELSYQGDFYAQAVFRKETGLDHFGKQIGFNEEIQLYDLSIDNAVYVECEDRDFVTRLLSSGQAKEALQELLKTFDTFEINGRKCLLVKTPSDQGIARDLAMACAGRMLALAARIPVMAPGRSATPITDTTRKGVKFLFTAACVFLVIGIILFIGAMSGFTPLMPEKFFIFSLYASVPLTAIFWVYLWGQLKGSSIALRSFLMSSLIGGIGVILVCWGGGMCINGSQDFSAPVKHATHLVDRHMTHSSKNGDSYFITLASWRQDLGDRTFSVGHSFYNLVTRGEPCEVITRAGLFGFEWISGKTCHGQTF